MHKHTRDRSYKYGVCVYTTSVLRGHLMKHSGHQPYKCNICDYAIGYWATVNRHNIKYTRERPNKCDLCEVLNVCPLDYTYFAVSVKIWVP